MNNSMHASHDVGPQGSTPSSNSVSDSSADMIPTPVGGGGNISGSSMRHSKLFIAIALIIVLMLAVAAILVFRSPHKTTPVATSQKPTNLVFAVHFLEDYQMNGVKQNGKVVSWGLNQYLNEYNQTHPGVKVIAQQIEYSKYADELTTLYNSGAAPDLYQIYSPWGASYVKNNMLDTPSPAVQADIKHNYVSDSGATINGKVWGYPTEVDNYALLYNKDLFKQAGIVDASGNAIAPKTWGDVQADAAKLVKHDAKGNITQYGIAFTEGNDWQVVDPFLSLLFSNNGSYLSADNKHALFNSTAGVQALDAELQLFKNKSTDVNGNFFDFGKGTVGMVVSPPWPKSTFAGNFGAKFATSVGVAPLPYMTHPATLQYSWFMGVMSSSPHKQAAWDFLKWLEAETQNSGTTRYGDFLSNTIGAIPARTVDFNSHKSVLGDFYTSTYVSQMSNSTAEPNVLQASQVKAALMAEIQKAWAGQESSKQALDNAAQSVNQILAGQ